MRIYSCCRFSISAALYGQLNWFFTADSHTSARRFSRKSLHFLTGFPGVTAAGFSMSTCSHIDREQEGCTMPLMSRTEIPVIGLAPHEDVILGGHDSGAADFQFSEAAHDL